MLLSSRFNQFKFLLLVFGFLINSSAFANNGFSVAYSDSGQGKPLVLIHAFPTDQRLWQSQQPLTQHFRVITMDLPGFGRSSPTNGELITMAQYADEIKKILNKLAIEHAIIGGESMGGYVALAFLKKYPNKVDGLILSNTQATADSPEMKIQRSATANEVLEHGTTQLIKNFMAKALSSSATQDTRNFLQGIVAQQDPKAVVSALRGMALREDTSTVLADTHLPVLIISGEKDTVISPRQSQKMHRLAKSSKLVVLPKTGHLSNLEQPEEWNHAVIQYFSTK